MRQYIPELPNYGSTITISHLMHHTAGLRDYNLLLSFAGIWDADYANDEDALNIIAAQKALDFAPGSRFSYSNTGYFLMSLIVQRVSGKNLRDFAHERIFKPLGMSKTFFLNNHQLVVPHRATGYSTNADGGFDLNMSNWMQTGDGAVQTTVSDLAKWQRNFDDPKVGGKDFIASMEQPGKLADGEPLDYASGLFVIDYRGLRKVSHSGAWAGYRADLLRFSKAKLSVAVLCNLADANPSRLSQRVADIYLEKQLGAEPDAYVALAKSISKPPKELLGTYWARAQGLVRTIEQKDGKLWYVRNAESRSEIGQTADQVLTLMDADAKLMVQREGKQVKGFELVQPNQVTSFEKVQTNAPDLKALQAFVGTYKSSELNDVQWTISIKDEKLFLKVPRVEGDVIAPAFKDTFLAGGVILRFQRDTNGQVNGIRVDAGRAIDLEFVRVAE